MAFVVELAEDQLSVRPIHRLVHGLQGVDARRALDGAFTVVDAGANTPEGIVQLSAACATTAHSGSSTDPGSPCCARRATSPTSPSCFATSIRPASTSMSAPRCRARPSRSASDAAAVAALVEKGAADAAVLLRPVTVAQIRAAAFAGVRMPEKTTFFSPKPRTGMVFRSLDEAGVAPT